MCKNGTVFGASFVVMQPCPVIESALHLWVLGCFLILRMDEIHFAPDGNPRKPLLLGFFSGARNPIFPGFSGASDGVRHPLGPAKAS